MDLLDSAELVSRCLPALMRGPDVRPRSVERALRVASRFGAYTDELAAAVSALACP